MQNLEANKANAQAFYDLMFNQCDPGGALEQFAGSEYIQHNPRVPDGKEGFINYYEHLAAEYPDKRTLFIRAIAEDNLVVLHCHQVWPDSEDYVGVAIFRFDDNGKIVEHWDVQQVIASHSKNNNGLF